MATLDVAQVKRLLGLTTSKHDDYITEMIPILLDYVKNYCNNTFMKNGVEELPGPVKLFIAKAIQFNMNPAGVSSRSMGGAAYSYETDYPESIMKLLRPYKKVRFV